MKKKYIVPSLQIEKFHVEDIITVSIPDVLINGIIDEESRKIDFADGQKLQAIDYRYFTK